MHSSLIEIGGYYELQLPVKGSYYPTLIALNSGRSCLEYILKACNFTKIFLPFYICDVVLEPIQRLGIKIEFYSINTDFTIKESLHLKETEVLLYVNYFGLMDGYISSLVDKFHFLILDNAQAFFSEPYDGVFTYYSPRKFFGVSDGGYLSSKVLLDIELEQDTSFTDANFLLTRIDSGAEKGYSGFLKNEKQIKSKGLKKMSKLSTRILASIDYDEVKIKREENLKYLHQELGIFNQLKINPDSIYGPMVYPFLNKNLGLREFLISNKVFVAKYWENVIKNCPGSSFEYTLANSLVAFPVDQRYGENEMRFIVNLVKTHFGF